MNIVEHRSDSYGKKVWLSSREVTRLLDHADDSEKRIAFSLGARCGLRSFEWLNVTPRDVVDTDTGLMLRVRAGKGDKYRETPIPTETASMIRAAADYGGTGMDESVLSVTSTRSLQRWIAHAAGELAMETGDDGWDELTTHDLRRTWATQLCESEVDPLIALEWGGWEDLETFLEHYKGAYSPEAQKRQREKVEWLS